MAFVALTDAETNQKKPLRQALLKKIKDDLDDLNGRVLVQEGEFGVFDHFVDSDHSAASDLGLSFHDLSQNATVPVYFVGNNWIYSGHLAADLGTNGNLAKPALSVARMSASSGVDKCYALSRLMAQFTLVTKPITLEGRFKLSVDTQIFIGLRIASLNNRDGTTDANGIWVERVDATNWRFVAYDGARQNGSNFTKPTIANWFKLKIIFTDDPSNRALCYIDDVLKETITAHLPTTNSMRAWWQVYNGIANANLDADWVSYKTAGLPDAA